MPWSLWGSAMGSAGPGRPARRTSVDLTAPPAWNGSPPKGTLFRSHTCSSRNDHDHDGAIISELGASHVWSTVARQ
jgi:hypothetical protein